MGGFDSVDGAAGERDCAILKTVLESTNAGVEVLELQDRAIEAWILRWPAAHREAASAAVESARGARRGHFRGDMVEGAEETQWDVTIVPIDGENDRPRRLLIIRRDVTVIANADRMLAQSEDLKDRADKRSVRFERLAEASDDFVIIAGLDRSIEYVNVALLRAMEVDTLEEFVAQGRLAFFAPKERTFFDETIVPALLREGRWSGSMQFRSFKTQTIFPVAYHAFALRDKSGTAVGLASVSRDVGDRRRVEIGMRALADTGAAMYDSLDIESTLRNVANAVVRTFASYCVVGVVTPDGTLRSIGASDRGSEFARHIETAARSRAQNIDHPAWRAVLRGDSTLIPVMPPDWLTDMGVRAELGGVADDLGMRSFLYVPIHSRQDGGIYGSLTCILDTRDPRGYFTVDDMRFCEEIAVRAGLALDHAKAYERERRIAMMLQEASLPQTLPQIDGLVLTADYRPGSGEATIGGDWYDAFLLDDGHVAISIGDVLGHGLKAAVTMGKVRQAMQAVATIVADPNAMLDVADRVVRAESGDAYATAMAGILDPRKKTFTFASAGHPGPLMRLASGEVVDHTNTTALLGMRESGETAQRTIAIAPGSLLLFFTDGLSELARDVMQGTVNIIDAIADPAIAYSASPAQALVEHLLGDASASDDIAVLAVAFEMQHTAGRPPSSAHERRTGTEIVVSFEAMSHARSRAKVLVVPTRLEEVSTVRRAIRSMTSTAGYVRDVVENVELATGELVANAITYGSGATIEVSLRTTAEGVAIGVTNTGPPFDTDGRELSEMLLAEHGRGLAILRALGCALELTVHGDLCTVTAIVPFGETPLSR